MSPARQMPPLFRRRWVGPLRQFGRAALDVGKDFARALLSFSLDLVLAVIGFVAVTALVSHLSYLLERWQ